ncbi:PREDICTED: uncharacterized protein LOC104748648 [Camelina sativa]|uniref:Uncharacterized protein LOC104748648 n=1 Tax=Camelina sativa TaxID=90675 RepID=A0ABM0WBD6_CAMSA|nr:PREDICTED: uncharacterized protein LOC104748648 [Camelina sativa]
MLQQLLIGQTQGKIEEANRFAELNRRITDLYSDLNGKFDTLTSRITTLEDQQTSASKQENNKGKAIVQSIESAHAINLRSGRVLQDKKGALQNTEDSVEQEGEEFQEEENQEARSIPPPYKPPLPFPGRFKKQMVDKYKALFDKQVREIELRMPLIDAFVMIPPYQKFLKDAVMERIKEVQGMVHLSHECSAIIQKQVNPQKLRDPGSFTIPCSIGPLTFNRCLCDLGASVSLMPLTVARRLGFTRYKPCNISLILADRSIRLPHGVLEDLPVRIGAVEVPTDFVVLEMDEEPKDPLILGRPFLATAGAIIDVREGKIDLNLGDDLKMTFDILETMKKPTIEGQVFWIEETRRVSFWRLETSPGLWLELYEAETLLGVSQETG